MSNPASSSSHWICTCCLAVVAVHVKVLMNLRQETWNEEPLQLLSIPIRNLNLTGSPNFSLNIERLSATLS